MASLGWYKGILICSHSRARIESLIAKHYRALWLAQEEKGSKLRARGIVYLFPDSASFRADLFDQQVRKYLQMNSL